MDQVCVLRDDLFPWDNPFLFPFQPIHHTVNSPSGNNICYNNSFEIFYFLINQ